MDKKSINFIKQYVNSVSIIVLTLLSMLSAGMLIAVAYMTKSVIGAIEMGSANDIIVNVCIAVTLLFIYAVLFGVSSYLTDKTSMLSTKNIVTNAHHHLLNSSYDEVAKAHSVESLKIVTNDAEIAVSTYVELYPTIASTLVKLVAGIVLMLFINYQITLIALAVGIVVCISMLVIRKPIKALHKKGQQAVAISNAYMQEGVKNVEVVKALNISDFVKDGVASRLDNVKTALLKKSKFVAMVNSIAYFVLEITFLTMLIYGGILISRGALTVGNFVVLISVIEIVKTPFMSATKIGTAVFNMLASAERVITIFDMDSDGYIEKDFDKIVFSGVSYSYDNKCALDSIDAEICKGDKLAIVGYSGAGKSTFLRMLIGLIKPTYGKISFVKGNEELDSQGKLLKIGYLPQNIALFNDTIYNNLVNGKDLSDKQITDAMKNADIYDDIMAKDNGLNYVLQEGGKGFSQGQMQRIGIARALLSDSNIIVLDEPFASLDRDLAIDIYNKLMALDKTIIIVSHDDFVRANTTKVIELGEKIVD